MFGRCNVHVEALPQRLFAAPGSVFMRARMCFFFPPESALSLEGR